MDKTKLLNLRFSKLHSAKVLFKLEFDTKDQVLSLILLLLLFIVSLLVVFCLARCFRPLMEAIVAFVSNSCDCVGVELSL